MIEYRSGDVTMFPVFGHGCNTMGVMGAGVAKLVRTRYPKTFKDYARRCADSPGMAPGEVHWFDEGGHSIANLMTQRFTGACAQLPYIRTALTSALRAASQRGFRELAIPWIGCGIGGLSPEQMRPEFDMIGGFGYDTKLVVCTLAP